VSAPTKRLYTILGASLVVAVIALLWLAGNVERLRRHDGERYTLMLEDGSGLPLGSPVRLAGVQVGVVEAIEVVDGRAMFTLVLDPSVELRTDAVAGPRAKSLLGQKYVELRPGSEDAPRLAPGEAIATSWDSYDVDEALNALEPIFGDEGSLLALVADVEGLFGLGPGDGAGAALEPEPSPEARVEELAAQIGDLREGAAKARELSETARDELPGRLADANATLSGRELDRTLDRLDRLSATTARDLPGLFELGHETLRDVDGALAEIDEVASGVSSERVAELDGVLDEVSTAVAEAKTTTAGLEGVGDDVGPLIATLELLSRRAAAIDELTIRKFLQEEGILTRFGGGDRKQARDRLDALDPE